jgi:hypothetical protein
MDLARQTEAIGIWFQPPREIEDSEIKRQDSPHQVADGQ